MDLCINGGRISHIMSVGELCIISLNCVLAMLYFNLDGYSTYCKKYKEYWSWVDKRNEERYKSR